MNREKIVGYRKKYGNHWISIFPDSLDVPWRQLTLQEFLDYSDLFDSNRYTETEIEDEIFKLACLEPLLIENIDILPSGTVSVVVSHILQVSGPHSIQSMNEDLNVARDEVNNFICNITTVICSVFPAYKPEDLFSMSYQDFMKRAAMTEQRLMSLGVMQQPFVALAPGDEVPAVQAPEKPSERKRREILEKKLADLNQKKNPVTKDPNATVITQDKMNDPTLSFLPENDLSKDPSDRLINQQVIQAQKQSALQGLEAIYPEYFKRLRDGERITPETIKFVKGSTPEEVKSNHERYKEKLARGEIKLPPVSDKKPIMEKKPVKVVKR